MEPSNTPVFAGEFRHSLDVKHRVALPSRWRQKCDREFFLIPSQCSDHLLGYPPAEFEKVSQLVSENPSISPRDQRVFIRHFYSKAQMCSVDKQGRLLIPADLRKLATLDGELLFVGAFNRFEIWNPESWNRVTAEEETIYTQVANIVGL